MLDFIYNRTVTIISKKPSRILTCKLAFINIFERYIGLLWKHRSTERGLPRLTRTSNSDYRVLPSPFPQFSFKFTLNHAATLIYSIRYVNAAYIMYEYEALSSLRELIFFFTTRSLRSLEFKETRRWISRSFKWLSCFPIKVGIAVGIDSRCRGSWNLIHHPKETGVYIHFLKRKYSSD